MPELATSKPAIFLRGSGDKFSVAVRPCPDDQPSLSEFNAYIAARTFARSLRWANGWTLNDEVDAATRRKAEDAEQKRIEAKRWGVADAQAR